MRKTRYVLLLMLCAVFTLATSYIQPKDPSPGQYLAYRFVPGPENEYSAPGLDIRVTPVKGEGLNPCCDKGFNRLAFEFVNTGAQRVRIGWHTSRAVHADGDAHRLWPKTTGSDSAIISNCQTWCVDVLEPGERLARTTSSGAEGFVIGKRGWSGILTGPVDILLTYYVGDELREHTARLHVAIVQAH